LHGKQQIRTQGRGTLPENKRRLPVYGKSALQNARNTGRGATFGGEIMQKMRTIKQFRESQICQGVEWTTSHGITYFYKTKGGLIFAKSIPNWRHNPC